MAKAMLFCFSCLPDEGGNFRVEEKLIPHILKIPRYTR